MKKGNFILKGTVKMANQKELDALYMGTALLHSKLSKCIRKKVGAALVTTSGIIIPGYNGTPSGRPNACEFIDENGEYITKNETLHGELNAILKAAKEGVSVEGSTLYVTLSPCVQCSAMITQAGIKRVVFQEEYRDIQGILNLKDAGIQVEKFKG